MKIAIHQMCSDFDSTANLAKMLTAIGKAARQGAKCYFAPEMSLLLDRDRKRAAASVKSESEFGPISALCDAAREHGIWLHIGSLPVIAEDSGGKWANRSLLISDEGEIAARYDKIHLFDVSLDSGEAWKESAQYVAGTTPVMAAAPMGAMGMTICYDLRFPHLFQALVQQGAQIFAVPAAFTVPTGKAHWHVLLRARAVETGAFVIAAAQSGQHADGRSTFGHSLVVDPWGEVLLDMGEGEGLGFAELDLARVAEARRQIPVQANRRDLLPVSRFGFTA